MSEIVEESNYYPFGLKQKGYNEDISTNGNSLAQQWKFGGKQYQEELGLNWYDVSARNYDPALGRWMNIDPLAEAMRRHSPYNYAFDNPIFFMDPDGMMPCPTGDCPDPPINEEPYITPLSNDLDGGGTQKDLVEFKDDNATISPVADPVISSEQGNRDAPLPGATTEHRGVDIVQEKKGAVDGENVVAPINGTIISVRSGDDGNGAGNRVHLKANKDGKTHSFFHLQGDNFAANLEAGDKVSRGQKIGQVGNTGNSTGSHLHYEIRDRPGGGLSYSPRAENSGLKNAPTKAFARRPAIVPASLSRDLNGFKFN